MPKSRWEIVRRVMIKALMLRNLDLTKFWNPNKVGTLRTHSPSEAIVLGRVRQPATYQGLFVTYWIDTALEII